MDDGGSPVTHYILETREPGSRDWNTIAELPKSADHFVVKDLVEGEEYDFRITAENKVGRSKPVEADVTVKPERKPGTTTPYRKVPKFLDARKLSCNQPKIKKRGQTLGYFVKKTQLQ